MFLNSINGFLEVTDYRIYQTMQELDLDHMMLLKKMTLRKNSHNLGRKHKDLMVNNGRFNLQLLGQELTLTIHQDCKISNLEENR